MICMFILFYACTKDSRLLMFGFDWNFGRFLSSPGFCMLKSRRETILLITQYWHIQVYVFAFWLSFGIVLRR